MFTPLCKATPLFRPFQLAALLLFVTGSASRPSHCTGDVQIVPNREGWINQHTYRVYVSGLPRKNQSDPQKRELEAKRAAIYMAHKTILEKFIGARVETSNTLVDFDVVRQQTKIVWRLIAFHSQTQKKKWILWKNGYRKEIWMPLKV